MLRAYYNEIDSYCCDWLSNLMDAGAITPGKIDSRSIEDVVLDDLAGFDRVHFFAGVGVWDYAANRAGFRRPFWSGSCPCQPFSAAGEGLGFADERHLWPAFYHLVEVGRPRIVVGEQVASKDGLAWLDLVQSDLEASDYAFGAIDLSAAGVGSPQIRQRFFWSGVADSERGGCASGAMRPSEQGTGIATSNCEPRGVAGAYQSQRGRGAKTSRGNDRLGPDTGRAQGDSGAARRGESDGVACRYCDGNGFFYSNPDLGPCLCRPSPTNGFWRAADWLFCRDELWRPVEPGTFPLADGASARVGRLRAYGNAIVSEAAQEFLEALQGYLDFAETRGPALKQREALL